MELYEAWKLDNESAIAKFASSLDEMKLRGEPDFAMLSVAAQEFRKLVDG
jgi:NAD-specific glutamate dehydrogenase